ncbi:hypothetical protein BTN50_1101 [Candidatus Enterovibrio altilux]|uniref:Uncharacterized protein n=1 Tax=Candidatus Enterovibrio altilux TaxID=1927128 RepID=A0A291B9B2_9GAMM|nr:hypothetical protein BTN50_1101 [Candidatus Enterovibrio luxaltus]
MHTPWNVNIQAQWNCCIYIAVRHKKITSLFYQLQRIGHAMLGHGEKVVFLFQA